MVGLELLSSFLLIAVVGNAWAQTCRTPPEARPFDLEEFAGRWYEIGKMQTAGGAFFEKSCVCTQLYIQPTSTSSGDATAANLCRFKTPQGKLVVANSTLAANQSNPGNFEQSFAAFGPKVAYNVIVLTADYAVEYDCGTQAGITNYCVHLLSRNRTMSADVESSLLALADKYDLNPLKLPYTHTMQTGCPDPAR